MPDDQMFFGDFVIRFEHKFLLKTLIQLDKFKTLIIQKILKPTTQYLKNTS